MRFAWAAGIGVLGLVVACEGGGPASLTVDLRTDYTPGVDFTRVRSVIDSRAPSAVFPVVAEHDFLDGVRVADLDLGELTGAHDLNVALMDEETLPLASRGTRVTVEGHTNVTVVIARREAPPCDSDADCTAVADCAEARCFFGTCLQVEIEDACGPGSTCSLDAGGCVRMPGAGCMDEMDCAVTEVCRSGACVQPTAFRVTRMDLLDPHLFIQASAAMCYCADATSIVTDYFNDDVTSLDRNVVFSFLPLAPAAVRNDFIAYGDADCTSATTCGPPSEIPEEGQATHTVSGAIPCFTAPEATLGGYTVPAAPAPGCFISDPVALTFDLQGATIDFVEIRVAATFEGDPATRLVDGVFAGFVTEDAARAAMFPSEISSQICGDPTLYAVLKGGGACQGGDDRDDLDGDGTVDGWWMYFSFEAERIDWME